MAWTFYRLGLNEAPAAMHSVKGSHTRGELPMQLLEQADSGGHLAVGHLHVETAQMLRTGLDTGGPPTTSILQQPQQGGQMHSHSLLCKEGIPP